MRKSIFALVAGFALAAASAGGSFAADETKMPGMDDAAMQEMMKLGSPGKNHKLLEPLVGEWTHTVTMRMQPDAAPQESAGTTSNKWIMGGRFLQDETHGSMDMGDKSQPFEGFGLLGYDNMKKEFVGVWIDNMVTGMLNINGGQYDPKTKIITTKGTMSCPMSGEKNKPFRSELKITDNDNYSYTMSSMDKSGKEFKSLEVVYKRKK